MDINKFLSIVNGAWTIMLTFFIAFLLNHLWEVRRTFSISDWFLNENKGTQVAVAIMVADLGNWIVRGAVWIWREVGAPEPLPGWLIGWIAFGAVVGTLGMLCKLRVFSIVRFGHGPWLACTGATAIFLLVKFW